MAVMWITSHKALHIEVLRLNIGDHKSELKLVKYLMKRGWHQVFKLYQSLTMNVPNDLRLVQEKEFHPSVRFNTSLTDCTDEY